MIDPKTLKIESICKRPGGQQAGVINRGVKITHIPTNLSVSCDYDRSQMKNRNICLDMIEYGLSELNMGYSD